MWWFVEQDNLISTFNHFQIWASPKLKDMIPVFFTISIPYLVKATSEYVQRLNNTFDLFQPNIYSNQSITPLVGNFSDSATIRSISACFFQYMQPGKVWHNDIILLWKYLLVVVELEEWMNDRMNKPSNENVKEQINECINEKGKAPSPCYFWGSWSRPPEQPE